MRIQHNIMAMSAYRNYTNNVSAMKKNLEKLSSGYKINRAGDDAAGLAISEKMRAQITGLETAQKNAKDGISLVQTAEGALTEVHDMLNRMVELATQSANGTYDNTTDRAQMQKELDQLKSEINRIADSSNFNGIKLLDGSMDSEVHNTVSELQRFTVKNGTLPAVGTSLGIDTVKHATAGAGATVGFSIDLHDIAFTNQSGETLTVNIGSTAVTLAGAGTAGTEADVLTGVDLRNAIMAAISTATTGTNIMEIDGQKFKVSLSNDGDNRLKFELQDKPGSFAGANVTVEGAIKAGTAFVDTTPSYAASGTAGTTAVTINVGVQARFSTQSANTINAAAATAVDGKTFSVKAGGQTFTVTFSAAPTTAAGYVAVSGSTWGDVWDSALEAINAKIDAYNDAQEALGGNTYTSIGHVEATAVDITTASTDQVLSGVEVETQLMEKGQAGLTGQKLVDYNVATTDIVNPATDAANRLASTHFALTADMIKDGGSVTIGKTEYVFTTDMTGKTNDGNKTVYVDLSNDVKDDGTVDLNVAAQRLTDAAGNNKTYTVGYKGTGATIYVTEIQNQTDFKKDGKSTLNTIKGIEESLGFKTVSSTERLEDAKALTLQIGDTAEAFNQLKVNIRDMHADSLGLGNISIADQDSAAAAVAAIKNAINMVSDVRGTLGATQNRLDHTINNLSVMTENIQDAESTIRDTDVADEMMAYTKNNILIQSAQAMLAQANQVPQGVLQLLQ